MTKVKLWHNSSCDKNQIVKKKTEKLNVTKLENSNYDKTQKLKLHDKTWNMTNLKLWRKKLWKGLFMRTFWYFDNPWEVLWAAFCDSRDVFNKVWKILGLSCLSFKNFPILPLKSLLPLVARMEAYHKNVFGQFWMNHVFRLTFSQKKIKFTKVFISAN